MDRGKGGWTIVELMLIIVVIGILIMIILPTWGNIRDKTREQSTKGSLGGLRSAIATYYADHDGEWPHLFDTTFVGVYMDEIPLVRLRSGIPISENDTNRITYGTTPQAPYGGWLYDSDTGDIRINHWEVDTHGVPYSSY
jgi:general secretion pathway protein G